MPALALLLALCSAPASAGASASSPGRLFEYGVGGRALGMGGAYVAMPRDAASLYYNPAGLALLDGRQIELMHAPLFEGAAYDYVGYAQNFKRLAGGWGAELLSLSATGGVGRDSLNMPTGSFGYSERGLGFGFGARGVLSPDLSLGASAKVLMRQLGSSSDKLFGLDAGAQYGPFLDDQLMAGVAVRNAVAKSQGSTSDALPYALHAGLSYRVVDAVTLALDASDSQELRAGVEYSFGMTSLRLGYAPDGLTFGGGILWRKTLSVDVAAVNNASLGMAQRISVGWRFGAKKPRRLSTIAAEYFSNGKSELQKGRYVDGCKSIEESIGIDPAAAGPQWKRKAARLRSLLDGMGVRSEADVEEIAGAGAGAALARRAVDKYLEGDDIDAMLLAHVAAGSTGRRPVFMSLLRAMSAQTRQPVKAEDVIPVEPFVQDRLRRTLEAFRARSFDLAARACEEAILVEPENAGAWEKLGSAYFAGGNAAKARQAYEKSLELEPANAKLRGFLKDGFKGAR